ncbi:MAG: multicopper oxidase domain-containing protein, partial [Methylobacteriaceae bacterium]|nr:multicopper oxidase domain-containing protein [Methylobacteriaceae bacterium]
MGLGLVGVCELLPRKTRGEEKAAGPPAARANAVPGAEGFTVLEAAPAKTRILADPAAPTDTWAYNGTVPGPLLRVAKGDEVRVRLVNRLDAPTSIHWHGVRIANAMDGVAGLTQAPVPPGGQFDYRFRARDSGTYWYHPDVRPGGAEQVARGLYGLLIVEEPDPPQVDREFLIALDDWPLDESGRIAADFGKPSDPGPREPIATHLTV